MSKKIFIPVIIGILAVAPVSCKKSAKKAGFMAMQVPVTSYTVERQNVIYYDSYPATVASLNEVPLMSEVAGYITGLFFSEGSHVTKGQKLYEIDRVKYRAALDEAKANVNISQANQEQAQRNADRYTNLMQQNAVARQVYDDALTTLKDAQMQLVAAKSALTSAETDYGYSLITAPFSGTIGFSVVKKGAYVVPGQTLLNTISSDDPMGVDVTVNEKSIPGFVKMKENGSGMTAMNNPDSTFRLILPDNSEYPYNGQLSVIGRSVNPETGTLTIRIVFPNSNGVLRPGMDCRAKVLNSSSGERVVIPFRAVSEQMSEYFVYKIENGKVTQVRIIPGLTFGEYLEVNQGLNPGDVIVLDGIEKVSNGSRVLVSSKPAGPVPPMGK